MNKNIIVCSDGTGNTAIKGRGTNVFKLFETIDLNGHRTNPTLPPQVAFYDDGVGTQKAKLLKIAAGATGFGLGRNVRQLYREVSRVYDDGDRIFLFGFSRGAFTVRTLAGLITRVGLLDVKNLEDTRALERAVHDAYRIYRRCCNTPLARFRRRERTPGDPSFRKDIRIAFIGVWDTVDAVGVPFRIADVINSTVYRFKFPDLELSDQVDRACHALALDDDRSSFHPVLWDEKREKSDESGKRRIEQVWFAGAHSNVGGGYPKQGMSLVALEWMLRKAEQSKLRLVDADGHAWSNHANVDDKLYNPRSGLGVFYRWRPRDVAQLCGACKVRPVVHISAIERIAHGTEGYAPGNVPLDAAIAVTPTGDLAKDSSVERRANALEAVLTEKHKSERPLLDRVGRELLAGRLAYVTGAAGCLALLVAGIATGGIAVVSDLDAIGLVGFLWHVVRHSMTDPLAAVGAAGLLLLLVAYGIAARVDARMTHEFSTFWFRAQRELREALKSARKQAAVEEGERCR